MFAVATTEHFKLSTGNDNNRFNQSGSIFI